MIGRRSLLHGALGAVACAAGGAAARADPSTPRFRRGIAVGRLVYWGRLRLADPGHYADQPFAGPDHALPDALLANVAAAGFDFVRLTVDPGPFLDLDGDVRDGLDRQLLDTVERLRRYGLSVLVDLHPNTQVRSYDPVTWLKSTADPMVARYRALVRRLARLLGSRELLGSRDSGHVAFELMNEPPYGYDPASIRRWQSLLETLHDAARAEAPSLPLVLSGARGGSPAGLMDLDPAAFRGSPVLFSFHYYEPHLFTHEGVVAGGEGTRAWRYLSALPYPRERTPRDAVLATVARNVVQDGSLDPTDQARALREASSAAESYLASGAGPGRIAADFDAVLDWAGRHGVAADAILLGEFGVTRTYGRYRAADAVSRAAWLQDVRMAAEKRRFVWALWELTGSGGMATVSDDDAVSLDARTLQALGLRGATR